jgi:bifunctional DNA-binding transcriptional regulator/antitoxin component of YhaV-PrlF toxin-antitoxin module
LAGEIDEAKNAMRRIMLTTVSAKGHLALPAKLRREDSIKPGHRFDIERIGRGEYRLLRQESPANKGLIDWLLACPVKGYFVPIGKRDTPTHLSKVPRNSLR